MKFSLHYTARNEIQYAGKMISKLSWFTKNGYKILLPKQIDENSKKSELSQTVLREFQVAKRTFDKIKFQLKKDLEKNRKTIDAFFLCFDYKVPLKVNIYFTIYGPGGSYFPPDKIIVTLKDNPSWILQMIIHETIHLTIEEPFIKKHKIPHWEKEAIVDRLCKNKMLENICSNYKLQKQAGKLPQELLLKLKFHKKTPRS